MDFGTELKNRRMDLGFTQKEIADALFVTRQTVSSWEVGRSYPNIDSLVAISDLYEISLDVLLKGDKAMAETLTKEVKSSRKNKVLSFLLIGILVIILFYIGISQMNFNKLYQDVTNWSSEGVTYSLVEEGIEYSVIKIDNKNIFTLPSTLELESRFLNSDSDFSLYYAGNDKDINISWISGPLAGHVLRFDKEFKFFNDLQDTHNMEYSYEIKKIIEKEITEDRDQMQKLFKETTKKWKEIN